MNFEELYKKYQDGTATEEEKAQVEAEIAKAKQISAILDGAAEADVIEPADREAVKKAKRSFNLKSTIRAIIVTLICLIVVSAAVCGTVFGIAYSNAKGNEKITEEEAIELAKECVAAFLDDETVSLAVQEVECELDMPFDIRETVFVYEINMISEEEQYEIEVSAKTGYAQISDISKGSGSFRNEMEEKDNRK